MWRAWPLTESSLYLRALSISSVDWGQHTLHESDSPLRKTALRQRIKTVMQERMFKVARIISHTRVWVLGILGSDSGFAVFERAFGKLRAA